MSVTVKSDNSTDEVRVDPISKALHTTLYNPDGTLAFISAIDQEVEGQLTAVNQTAVLYNLNGISSGLIQLLGTWVGSVSFQGSLDNFITFTTLSTTQSGGAAPNTTPLTANGFYRLLGVVNMIQVRAIVNTYTSGTIIVRLKVTGGNGIQPVISTNAAGFLATVNIDQTTPHNIVDTGLNPLTDAQLRATPIPVTGTVVVDESTLATTANQTNGLQKTQVTNFPATQAVTGTFFQATQPVSGTVGVSNFPASQTINGTVTVANPTANPETGLAKDVTLSGFATANNTNLNTIANNQTNGNEIVNIKQADLCVSVTASVGQGLTATIPAVASKFHNITQIDITAYSTAVRAGSATPVIVSTTNINGGVKWIFSSAAAIGAVERVLLMPTLPIKSAAANTATTIIAPATANVIWNINVFYNTST